MALKKSAEKTPPKERFKKLGGVLNPTHKNESDDPKREANAGLKKGRGNQDTLSKEQNDTKKKKKRPDRKKEVKETGEHNAE